MELISVIVPVYNTEKLLDRCIESIVNQTYSNLQIILVNDGSTDNSLSVCKRWEEQDCRVSVIDKRNGGQSSARNAGLDVAIGKWISFIDSDDQIETNFYEKLLECVHKNNAAVGVCPILSKHENEKIFDPYKSSHQFAEVYDSSEFLNLLCINDKTNGFIVASVNKIFSGDLWNGSKKIRYIEGRVYEDDEIVARMYAQKFVVAVSVETAYFYIMNPSSTTNSGYSMQKWSSLISYYERIVLFEKASEHLYKESITMFLYLYIEHYYKMKGLNIKVNEMRDSFLDALKRYKNTFPFSKTTLRYDLFRVSPKLYMQIIKHYCKESH